MISSLRLVTLFATIAAVFGGGCLNDWNTNQPSSAWNQRLWSYSPKSAATPSSSSSLTFTSYNLQSSISSDCKSNPETQANYMRTDYVGNQEVVQGVDTRCNCNMPQIIADQTGKSTRFVMTFPWRTGQYGINAGTSQNIVDTKYYMYNANSEQRALVAIKTFPAALQGRALWFISTHLDYSVWAARQSQATQLVQWVRDNIISQDSSASVVVVGDFNGASDDGFYGIMKGLFKNTWEVKNGSPSGGATYPSNWPSYRFDHIWFYVPSSIVASVESVDIDRTLASDHFPLHATIKFTVPGSSTPAPTPAPTAAPTKAATSAPTPAPTAAPTKAPTAAPTSAPTAAPTSAPTAAPTSAPTKAATSAPTSAPSSGSCSAALDWNASGNNVVIRNTGTKAIKTIQITFGPSIPSNNWNWVATSTSNVFTIPDWAFQTLGAGQSYTSSGYWVSGDRPSATVTRISC